MVKEKEEKKLASIGMISGGHNGHERALGDEREQG